MFSQPTSKLNVLMKFGGDDLFAIISTKFNQKIRQFTPLQNGWSAFGPQKISHLKIRVVIYIYIVVLKFDRKINHITPQIK